MIKSEVQIWNKWLRCALSFHVALSRDLCAQFGSYNFAPLSCALMDSQGRKRELSYALKALQS